jgi:hypothetical protein
LKRSFYQDRLGTNIGKTQKQTVFSQDTPQFAAWRAGRFRTSGEAAAAAANGGPPAMENPNEQSGHEYPQAEVDVRATLRPPGSRL